MRAAALIPNRLFTAGLLALAGTAAMAQTPPASFLTLYGFLDVGVGVVSNGEASTRQVLSGTSTASRWGLRLREDLGGGWAALANLESGIFIDTGAHTINRAWSRGSSVGLSNLAYGELTLGRQLTPQAMAYGSHGAMQATGPGYWGLVSGIIPLRLIFSDNAVVYRSPVHSGVTVRAMLSTGYDAQAPGGIGDDAASQQPAGSPRTGRQLGLSVAYAAGPLSVSLGGQGTRLRHDAATGQTHDFRELVWSGSYDLGAVKLYTGVYVADDDSLPDDLRRAIWLGGIVPLGPGRLGVQVGHRRDDARATPVQAGLAQTGIANDGLKASATVLAAFYDHALSKRTALYASWAKVANSGHASLPLGNGDGPLVVRAARPGADPSALSVGLRHTF